MTDVKSALSRQKVLLDPQKLQHFLYVYELKNFARAADEIGITQQAISKSIARLEAVLELKLFERGAFGAEATSFGHVLAKRARIIIAESRLATAELGALKGAADGFVNVGFGWSFLPRIAPQVIERFRRRRPGITLSISTGESRTLFGKLLAGDLEFVVSAPSGALKIDDALETQELFTERDIVVMRADHPLSKGRDITLAALSEQTWLVSLVLLEQWSAVSNAFAKAGLPPPSNLIDMDSVSLAKSMIAQSDGVALLARELVADELERGDFVGVEISEIEICRPAYFTVRSGAVLQPAANALKSDLMHICKELIVA